MMGIASDLSDIAIPFDAYKKLHLKYITEKNLIVKYETPSDKIKTPSDKIKTQYKKAKTKA